MSPDLYVHTGPEPLSEIDLVALVLGQTPGRASARTLAASLLDEHGSLQALVRAGPTRLADTPGIGVARAVRLHAALSLGLRAARETPNPSRRIATPEDALTWLGPPLAARDHELVWALYVGSRGRVLHAGALSSGTTTYAPLEPRALLRRALAHDASGVILAHNHPSGDPEPSADDLRTTRDVARSCQAVGIQLLDHLVVAGDRWVSLAKRGVLPCG